MNGIQNHKALNIEKPVPGCLGRVVNLFDLSAGMPENSLLTDKPHGSLLSRSRSDVSGMSLVEKQIEDKATKSELQKTHGTPIKMLIAQEMSKELDSKQKPTSVVAKLMGLDSLPLQKPSTASQRSHSRGSSRSQSCVSFGSWQEEHEVHQSQKQNDYKDVYEVLQSHNKYVRDKLPQQERFSGSSIEKRMALVRQNFIELKRLSADERLRQSQQFQDALEVLSSNKDSFLQFLQEPNSMFSQKLSDVQSISPPSEAKRITILRPAKIVEHNKVTRPGKKNDIQTNEISRLGRVSRLDNSPGSSSPTACKLEDSQVQATRIVVLKPSPGKSHDIKAVVSPLSSSPKASCVKDPYTGFDGDAQESREVAKEITRHVHENTSQHRRDETLLSSVFSNGYTGDESSFNKSEIEFATENLSDSEAISPTSRHSWDYINRLGSPYSLSSFSRASYSPESSVCREAKKRLSERWAMMASNGNQEQKHVRRSSSTLGEMLALSDMKKSVMPEDNYVSNEQEIRRSTSCFTSDLNEYKCNASARNILRSKSIPASSSAYVGELDSEVSDPKMDRTAITKELTKAKSMTSLLKGRVSSFFFSRTFTKQKSSNSRDEIECAELPIPSSGNDVNLRFQAAGELPDPLESSNKASTSYSLIDEPKERIVHTEARSSATKSCPFVIPIENQEQPSPISVLEPPFQEDDHGEHELSDDFSKVRNGLDLPVHHVKSSLLDKCPPIGSIARTLSWDDSCTENVSPCPIKSSAVPVGAEEERQEMCFLVQTLIAAAKLGNEVQSDSWHSDESPLDPSLRDNYVGQDDKETMHATKLRHIKSVQKLVFDCVNAALVELAVSGSDPWKSRARDYLHDNGSILDCLWSQMELFSGEMSFVVGEGGDKDSLVVEELVRKQVVGKGWVDHSILDIDNFRKEIEGKLLEELVQETVEVFSGSL